ncbi:apolipoprotein B-100-like, partial [Micropterus salmoides]|uniref:apolipoprotein B-100-like n=1 Tax=Micropterus salmoides TaxID=27706 RepID=UPI0018EC23DC
IYLCFIGDIVKGLHMEAVEDKNAVQDKDAGLNLLNELATLPETEGERRAHLFHKLVTMVRGMKAETLIPAIPEALAMSRVLTYQVLVQCGTPECSSAIMQILRTFDSSSLEVDASVFAMGLISNPSALLINDMLEMAKYKHSKPIMYALSNVVKRYYKAEGKLIPEIHSVAEFMAAQLGDCSDDSDKTFMTLRVIGNMASAVGPASPALRAAVIQCVNQPAASQAVQEAAIQVYRLTPVPDEAREVLMQVLLDNASPMQKRIAAYLVLMKDPQPTELAQLANALPNEQDQQVKSFVISHITNILSSTDSETQQLRQKIRDALQGNEIGPIMDPTKFSRNYKIGSVEGNMIFEGTSYLPKEVMLKMTLKAFGYDIDMMEIGMEGKGFEPTVDALFGENGFFPDTALKTMYFVSDNMPLRVTEILQNMLPALKKDRMKRQASQNLMRDIGRNFNKLVREIKTESPEAMVYLRLLGNELGYLKTNEITEMAYSAVMMIDSMFKMFPTDLMKALMTKDDNTIFAHYIFMDNEFFLPTVTGVPLRIALSGTFTPGIKGGLKIAPDMSDVTFMPSAGIEFVTQVGSHIPEYVNSGLEMHTSIFHESGLSAKISVGRDNLKLTIPAPPSPTKLIKMTNTLVAVTGLEVKTIPPMVMDKVDFSECTPFFAGMKYCTDLQYIDAFSQETTPYFPFTGDSKFAVELHPTGEVTEYTATVAYELLREGEEGRQKVDSVKVILRAEGADPTEARAIMKYNRRKNVITADIQIPDYDVEAGVRLGVVDGNTKSKGTHSISLDFLNKNIPQLSLVGRANLKAMKEGMLQVQLLVPSINADASVTANMKRDEELQLELKSDIKLLETTSEQKITMKYETSKIEVEVKSDINSEILGILPYASEMKKLGNAVLDMRVGETDMTVFQIFKAFVKATNNHMEMYAAEIPFIQNFRVPEIPEISLPETLFLNAEAKAVYHFNDEQLTIAIPLPLGGKSTEELNFPPALTTPHMSMPQFGLEIVSVAIPIPELFVPDSLTLSIPLFGKAEVSTLMRSNLYNMEASVAVGKDVVETPSYSAKFDVKGTSPVDILSINIEGLGMLATTDSIKAQLKSSLAHKFIEASISIVEDATITDKINLKSSSKIEATSPFGLSIELEHTGMAGIHTEQISADSNFEGMFKAGPMYGKTISIQSFSIFPFWPEAKIDSTVQIDSTIVKAQNTIKATLSNGEFSLESATNVFEDTLTHVAELSFKDNRLSLKCDANALTLGMKIRNQAEASVGAGEVAMRMETNADHSDNRVYSLLTASLDVNGLALNSDATVKLLENEATHKATLRMNKDGLTTSGTTTLQSPLSLENTFNAGLDASRATLSITNKAAIHDIKVDNANTLVITLSSLDFNSKAEATSEYASYTHDVTIDLKPYTASANVNNNLKLLAANFINEAQLQAELYKMDLTGSLKAIYGEEEIKHTYLVNYADMTTNVKCSTTGKLFGTHMSHNTELEVIGLAARITNDARFNSQLMRFDHTIHCSFVPFDFNLDAIFNADGDMTMYGKHSAQIYGKFLLNAQPLAFASSHECKASVTQQLDNGFSLETTFDNKMDNVLSLQEQKSSFRLRSKVNEHAFNQGMSVYNEPERTGIEVSGTILTNILNTASAENQEFAISGFLKYDKNTDSHIIQFPLIENLSVFLENIKGIVVYIAEGLQNYINNEEIRAKLEALPQHVSDFVSQMNIEGNLIKLKQYFNNFAQEYVISMEDVEASLRNLKVSVEKLLADLTVYIQNFAGMVKDIFASGTLPDTLIQKIQQLLNAINEEYDIKAIVIYVIDTMREMIQQIDLEKLKGSSISFLHDIDAKYEIVAKLQTIMTELKKTIESVDMQAFAAELKRYILSINFKAHIEELLSQIPTEMFSDITNYIEELIQDFDILCKINTFYTKIRELIVKFEADRKVQAILEKVAHLIKQFRIEETIRAVAEIVKDADIPTKFMQVFRGAISYLKETEIMDIISQFNVYIGIIEQKFKSFGYNDFVNHSNRMIAQYAAYVNDLIRSLEIPQKLEATRELANFVLSSVRGSVEQLREIKIVDFLKIVKDIFDQAVLSNLKGFAQMTKQTIAKLDVNAEIASYLELARKCYTEFNTVASDMFTSMVETIKKLLPQQKIVSEILQIIEGLITGLKNAELNIPSFIIPLTDLVVSSMKFSIHKFHQFEIPTQLEIPKFTILGFYTVQATTISTNDIKQRIIDLIDFVLNFEMKMFDMGALFGDLTMNYLTALPEFSLPEITVPEFFFPTLPHVPAGKLVKTLQLPTFKLPVIPSEIMIPAFGKFSYEIKVNSPIYFIRNAAEVQSSVDVDETPQLTAFLTSQGTSLSFEILNFNLDSTARIAVPKGHHVVAAETLKFTHNFLALDHHSSVTFYEFSAQASAKTIVKATTAPYNAELLNEVFLSTKGGLSATLDTSYKHVLNLPVMGLTGETSVTQKAVAHQEGTSITITVGNQGTTTFNSHESIHKSDLQVTVSPSTVKLSFVSDTDTFLLKMRQTLSADFVIFSYFKFDIRSEAEGPTIKSNLLVGSIHVNLHDMKLELKATHNTDLIGVVSGALYNMVDVALCPREIVFRFQNKGNTKVNVNDEFTSKIDLQNDYSATFRPDTQHMNTVALARLNQYKLFWNFTVENNEKEAAIFSAVEGEANLDFLTRPISIPEIDIPFVDLHTPAISDLDFYDQIGLKHILTTTEQTIDVDAKVVYQKSQAAPLIDMMGLIQIPSVGNLISELSFKSAIINLNVNAGLYAEDDLVFRLGASTASVFEGLKAKLDGTTSLTTKRGIKLANSLSLENRHIEGTHDSSIRLSTETFESAVSVVSVAKIALPILNLEANQNLVVDTKSKLNAVSTLKMTGDFNIPVIKAVGKAETDKSLKLEGTLNYVSMESSTKANIDGTVLDDYLVLGVLDNEVNLYLNNNGLRSTSKYTADAKLNHGTTTVIGMDVNENLAVEASLSRVYAVLKYTGNNEANLFNFNTKGKHISQAAIDIAPTSSLTADMEIDISQPSSLGDFTIFEKTVAEATAAKQKFSTTAKLVSPLYTTNMVAEAEGSAPVFNVNFRSSATSVVVFLDYDLDSSITINFEHAGISLTKKMVFTHSDLTMDIQHILSHTLSDSRLALNVDITSPAFTDVNFRYAVRKDGISATVSIPSTGFLGLQVNGRVPSQMNARLYGRYASDPGKDVDIFTIRASAKNADKINVKMVINMDAPDIMLSGLQERLPAITSCLSSFAEKYQLFRHTAMLKNSITHYTEEAHNIANSHAPHLSQVSILFRNTVVQYQKTVHVFLDAAIKVLRETHVKLPGSEKMTPLIEVLNKITTSIAIMLEKTIHLVVVNVECAFSVVIGMISKIQVTMPIGDVMAGAKVIEAIRERVKTMPNSIADLLEHLESLDTFLEKLGDTLKFFVDKAQDIVDNTLKSDVIVVYINAFYDKHVSLVKTITRYANRAVDMDDINGTINDILDIFRFAVNQFTHTISDYMQKAPAQYRSYVKIKDRKLEIYL